MKLETYDKQPREDKDYDIDYAEWLGPMGDTLDEAQTLVDCLTDADDTSMEVYATEMTLSRLKLWVRGGTHGARYKVTVIVTTVGRRTDESELIFKVKDV